MRKIYTTLLAVSLLAGFTLPACKKKTSYEMSNDLFVGIADAKIERFDSVALELGEDVKEVAWSSSDESVAVIENGTLYALKAGEVVISAVSGNEKQEQTISVLDEGKAPRIDVEYLPVMRGNSYEMDTQAFFNGKELDGVSFSYSVADTAIATIQNGILQGVSYGETTVTISLLWRGQTLTKEVPCEVTKNVAVYTDKAEYTVYTQAAVLGEPFATETQIQTEVYYENEKVDGLTLAWTSENTEIATVDADGKVSAVAYGETYIVGTCEHNGETLSTRKIPVKVAKPHLETKLDFPFVMGTKNVELDASKALGAGYSIGKVVNVATGTEYAYTDNGADLSSLSAGDYRFDVYEENEEFSTRVNMIVADYVVTDQDSLFEATKAQNAYVVLANDISVSNFETGIYSNTHYSTGTFNGLGYTITVDSYQGNNSGLYGYIGDFVFKNLSVKCTITGLRQGALFYYCFGNLVLDNCYIETTIGIDTAEMVAGLGDYVKKGSMISLTNTIVKVNGLTKNEFVQKNCGGLVARCGTTDVHYTNSYIIAEGTIISNYILNAKTDLLNQQKGVLYKTAVDFAQAKTNGKIVLDDYNHYWDLTGAIPTFK